MAAPGPGKPVIDPRTGRPLDVNAVVLRPPTMVPGEKFGTMVPNSEARRVSMPSARAAASGMQGYAFGRGRRGKKKSIRRRNRRRTTRRRY